MDHIVYQGKLQVNMKAFCCMFDHVLPMNFFFFLNTISRRRRGVFCCWALQLPEEKLTWWSGALFRCANDENSSHFMKKHKKEKKRERQKGRERERNTDKKVNWPEVRGNTLTHCLSGSFDSDLELVFSGKQLTVLLWEAELNWVKWVTLPGTA